ncbi:MAG: 23S rRNA (uracil(1939)-C(5))-methyltransferase RlmD, partial [Synergistaceae bacterium]|nr:23S rRNA (uracil(1939)-C(5))-methyltransferase RlmD [Synergistaceae bacterium]
GVGSLTGYLSNAKTVTSVEEWGNAVELMKENLKNNDITNVTPLCGKAEEVMTGLNGGYDLVVPDPPRSGCERVVLEKMLEFGPEHILYVSCNPATLARDAKILSEGNCGVKYKLKSVRAFDMFPQTVHVETVLLLERER